MERIIVTAIDPARLQAIAHGDLGSADECMAIARALLNLLAAGSRKSDPETSAQAAARVNMAISGRRLAVLTVLRQMGAPWTDADLISEYRKKADAPKQTDSGIRSRRAELARLGHCRVLDTVRIQGRRYRRWVAC